MNISKLILGTGCYSNIKSGNTVSITGDGGTAWGYFGPSYKKLAPRLVTYEKYAEGLSILEHIKQTGTKEEYLYYRNLIEDEYIRSYYELRLQNLNMDELLNILYERFGNNIILLCHEPVDEFCHRRLVADFLEIKYGIYIPEIITYTNNFDFVKSNPIRYKQKLLKIMK